MYKILGPCLSHICTILGPVWALRNVLIFGLCIGNFWFILLTELSRLNKLCGDIFQTEDLLETSALGVIGF